MAETKIAFEFDGPDARAEAQALAEFLEHEWSDWPAHLVQRRPVGEDEAATRGELTAWIAIILSLPAVFKNAFDLADRIKLKEKVERLLAWARRRRECGQRVPRLVLPRGARSVPLDEARLDEILDDIATQVAQQRADTP